MIRQQNLCLHVQTLPLVELACVQGRGRQSAFRRVTAFMSGRQNVRKKAAAVAVAGRRNQRTEALCVSPSAADLPFCLQRIAGILPLIRLRTRDLSQFLLCSAAAKNSLSLPWLHS